MFLNPYQRREGERACVRGGAWVQDRGAGPAHPPPFSTLRPVLEMALSCASSCMLHLACGGESGEQEPFPHVTHRFGVVSGVPLLATSNVSPHSCSDV